MVMWCQSRGDDRRSIPFCLAGCVLAQHAFSPPLVAMGTALCSGQIYPDVWGNSREDGSIRTSQIFDADSSFFVFRDQQNMLVQWATHWRQHNTANSWLTHICAGVCSSNVTGASLAAQLFHAQNTTCRLIGRGQGETESQTEYATVSDNLWVMNHLRSTEPVHIHTNPIQSLYLTGMSKVFQLFSKRTWAYCNTQNCFLLLVSVFTCLNSAYNECSG